MLHIPPDLAGFWHPRGLQYPPPIQAGIYPLASERRYSLQTSQARASVWRDSRLLVVTLSLLAISIGFGMVSPVMPFYATALGASPTQLGILASTFAVTQFLLTPLAGAGVDRFGRKPFAFLGMAGFALSNAIYALSTSYGTLVLARGLEGAFAALVIPAIQAYMADITIPQTRGRASALLNMGMNGGMVIGPGLGGYLAYWWGYRMPFFAAAGMAALSGLFIWLFMHETHLRVAPTPGGTRPQTGLQGLKEVLALGGGTIAALFFLRFVLMFSMSLMQPVTALYTNARLGWEAKELGNLFTLTGVVTMLVPLGVGPLIDRRGRKPTLLLGSVLGTAFTAGLIFIGGVKNSFGPVAAGAFTTAMMVGNSACGNMRGPATDALVGDLVPQDMRGKVMGALTTVGSLGQILGPFLGASLYQYASKEAPYALCAALLLVMTLTVVKWVQETLPGRRAPVQP